MPAKVGASTRPVRALNRGLELLGALNRLERGAINTLAAAVHLPRTTTFRILETLRAAGYIDRDPHDDCYHATVRVRSLADGFGDEALAAHLAKPLLTALSAEIAWPLSLATAAGATMLVRESSASHSPLLRESLRAGVRIPMLSTAAGRTYLAHCPAPQRDALLDLLSRSTLPEDRLARNRFEIERLLNETRAQGYGMANRERNAVSRPAQDMSLALPVRANGRVLATVAIHYTSGAVPLRAAVEQFLPKMHELVRLIAEQFP